MGLVADERKVGIVGWEKCRRERSERERERERERSGERGKEVREKNKREK